MTDLKTAEGVAAFAMGECDGEILKYAEEQFIPKAIEAIEKTCDVSSIAASVASGSAAANILEAMLHAAVEQFLRDHGSGDMPVAVVSFFRKRVFTLMALRLEHEARLMSIAAQMRLLAEKKPPSKEVIQ